MNTLRQLLLFVFLLCSGFLTYAQKDKKSEEQDKNGLCVGDYFTEQQGKEFLEGQRKMYTTRKEWIKRAAAIRQHILEGTG
ncbi:MAG: hypothetical protein LWW85_09665, partial [Marinilabiliales bacterium]|nr:hypothetical protein [Marinilabiliales bacterium]